jgi:hypothetical protein
VSGDLTLPSTWGCDNSDENYFFKKIKQNNVIFTLEAKALAGFFSCFTKYPNVGHKICIFDDEQKMTKIVLNLFKIRKKIKEL